MKRKPHGSTLMARTSNRNRQLAMVADDINRVAVADGGGTGTGIITDLLVPVGGGGSTSGGGGGTTTGTTTYEPPYSYKDTDAADCTTLKTMIGYVVDLMTRARFTPDQNIVYNDWLAYAQKRYETQCNVKIINPPPPPSPLPIDISPAPTVDNPHPSSTITPPSTTPFGSGGGGGGGGAAASTGATPAKQGRNWIWLIAAGIGTIGLVAYVKS